MTSCEICKRKFSTKGNLKKHQLKAKYCLKIRNSESKSQSKPHFKCEFCDKTYTTKLKLANHHKTCTFKESIEKDKLIEKLQKTVREKDEKIERITKSSLDHANFLSSEIEAKERKIVEFRAKYEVCEDHYSKETSKAKIKNTTYNITQQKLDSISITEIEPLTIEYVRKKITDNYTYEKFIADPIDSIVDLVVDMISIVTDDGIREFNYACTDVSRYKCHRLIESMEWQGDSGAYYINKILNELDTPVEGYLVQIKNKDKLGKPKNMKDVDIWFDRMAKLHKICKGIMDKEGPYRKKVFGKVRGRICSKAAIQI